jgi:predicted  nucleic acid-binding Zn-ribbon protein
MSVKNNREYSAMLKEIQGCESEIKKTEDRILESMVAIDTLGQESKDEEEQFRKEEKQLLEQRRELESLAENHQSDHDQLLAVQSAIEERIKHPWLLEYRKISEKRNGVGLAEAKDGYCTVCRVRLRAQVYTDVRVGDSLRYCDSCGRILYRLMPSKPAAAIAESAREEGISLPESVIPLAEGI